MTLPLLLCTLIALTSGLHFGQAFAGAHRRQASLVLPVLAHMAVSAVLMVVSTLLDRSDAGMLWMVVATASLTGLAIGALLPVRLAAPAVHAPAARPDAETAEATLHAA